MPTVSLTILVVDDNTPARYATARLLRHAGFEVLEASDGPDALALVQVAPDVVLLDVHLGEPDGGRAMDGLEVCRRIRRAPAGADILVIMLTAAHVEDDDKLRGLEAGADAYLTVPVDIHVLVATVRAVVRTRQSARSRTLASLSPDLGGVPRDHDHALRLLEDARRALRARDELLAMVAQELTSPLSSIQLTAELLRRRPRAVGGQRADRLLENVVRAAAQGHRLVVDLVDLAALDAGTLALHPAPCDAAELAKEAVEQHRGVAADRGLALELQADDAQGLVVECDRQRILQVFTNLVGNAVKYSPAGGRVRVTATPRAGAAAYAVVDEGPGIAPHDLERVFDRFVKGRQPPAGGGADRGPGLGLAIAKGIVDAHGGRIWAASTVGKGSEFQFTLPAGPPT